MTKYGILVFEQNKGQRLLTESRHRKVFRGGEDYGKCGFTIAGKQSASSIDSIFIVNDKKVTAHPNKVPVTF